MNHETTPARILLVDDHPAVRQGLALLFHQEGFEMCGEAESMADTLAILPEAAPDLVLVDLSLRGESGLELIRILRERQCASLAYSMHDDAAHVEQAFAAGAGGYVTKRELSGILLEGVRQVMAGQRYLSPQAAQCLAGKALASIRPDPADSLSERERQILDLLGRGEGTPDIAAALNISTRTVESYYSRMVVKLDLDGMKALRRYAVRK
jgi:DNA-binding NarL/FixJ family response regulator